MAGIVPIPDEIYVVVSGLAALNSAACGDMWYVGALVRPCPTMATLRLGAVTLYKFDLVKHIPGANELPQTVLLLPMDKLRLLKECQNGWND